MDAMASVATGISPAPGSPQEKEELFELNPHVGTNLPLCEPHIPPRFSAETAELISPPVAQVPGAELPALLRRKCSISRCVVFRSLKAGAASPE